MAGIEREEFVEQNGKCQLKFQKLESEMNTLKEATAHTSGQVDQIHGIVCGDGNGKPGIREQFRNQERARERTEDRLQLVEEHIANYSWKLWQKFAAVLVVGCAVASVIIQLVRIL